MISEMLTSSIDAFIGIAGANQGLVNCLGAFTPICSTDNGLYLAVQNRPFNILQNINSQSGYEGNRVSLWSVADEIIRMLMIGTQTHVEFPIKMVKSKYTMGHFQLKNQTGDVIFDMLQNIMSKNNISHVDGRYLIILSQSQTTMTSMTRPVK